MNLRPTYQPWGETFAELADAGRRAEEASAETLWVSELHRGATGTAAALAATTSTARVGTSIVLGLGSGVKRLNEDWHKVPFGKPVGRTRNDLDVVVSACWP